MEPILNKLVEGSNVKMKFSKFTLGIEPLVFVSIKAVTEVPNEVGLDIEAKWAASDPEVQLDVQFMGLAAPIAIEKVEFFGVVRIVFGPLCDWWPSFSAMQVAFIGKPTINFNLRLVGGDITAFPFIEKLLTNLIKNVLVNLMVWPNKLDIGITNDLGAKSVSNSGIVRITIRRASNLPQLDRLKAAAKMRPGGGARGDGWRARQTKIVRATKVGEGQDPTYVDETFDVRVHDIRGAKLSLSVVDTATTYKNVKAAGRQAFGVGKRGGAADDSADAALERRLGRATRMSKAEKSTEMSSAIEGEKRLKKSSQSVLGVCEYEVGQLVDKPYEETSVVLSLSDRKDLTSKMARAFRSSKRDARGEPRRPRNRVCRQVHALDDIEEDVDEQERVRGMSLEDIIAGGDLAQFCGVLHVRLIRGDHPRRQGRQRALGPVREAVVRQAAAQVVHEARDAQPGVGRGVRLRDRDGGAGEQDAAAARGVGLGQRRQARVHGQHVAGREARHRADFAAGGAGEPRAEARGRAGRNLQRAPARRAGVLFGEERRRQGGRGGHRAGQARSRAGDGGEATRGGKAAKTGDAKLDVADRRSEDMMANMSSPIAEEKEDNAEAETETDADAKEASDKYASGLSSGMLYDDDAPERAARRRMFPAAVSAGGQRQTEEGFFFFFFFFFAREHAPAWELGAKRLPQASRRRP